MAISYATAIRNSRLAAVATAVNAGAGGGKITLYTGERPAAGGTATTALAVLTFNATAFGTPSNGQMTANAISGEESALATGEATWFRVTDSDDVFVLDGDVGTIGSGADLEMNSVNIGLGQTIDITSFTITEGNP